MITKILFTMAIIGAVALYIKHASSRDNETRVRQQSTDSARIAPGRRAGATPARIAAFAVIAIMLAGTGLWVVLEWREAHEILGVRVINSSTGAAAEYEAYRSDIGVRSFRTLDGRRVNLAEVERLEVME